ncbi:MAG TPA: hypothetical protein VK031_08620 [Tissierellaceae bacterium]|nr:hypothetical protein [Tissierellaceae bacterium]
MQKNIPFKIIESDKKGLGKEAVTLAEDDDKVRLTITKEVQTPAYSVEIEKIVEEDEYFKIYYRVVPPETDTVQLQVMTYKTIDLEINKEDIGDPPYKFVLNEDKEKLIER